MARPLTASERDELKKRLVEVIPRNWGIIGRCARELGVGYDSVSRLLEEDEELAELARTAKASSVDAVVGRLYETAMQPGLVTKADVAPVLFFLKAVGGMSETQRVEHSGKVNWTPPPSSGKADSDDESDDEAPTVLSLVKASTGTT